MGYYIGGMIGVMKADTRSLDYSSYAGVCLRQFRIRCFDGFVNGVNSFISRLFRLFTGT